MRRVFRSVPPSITGAAILGVALLFPAARDARADLTHDAVEGAAITKLALDGEEVSFVDLERPRAEGPHTLAFQATGAMLYVPPCAGRVAVRVDGKTPRAAMAFAGGRGPMLVPLVPLEPRATPHAVELTIGASAYEKRIACGEPPRAGDVEKRADGVTLLTFASPQHHPDAGTAVVFVPRGHDPNKPGALLVGVHPWNGSPWTYASYRELLEGAQAHDVVCLMPSGLGNSLYVADAEDEVMRAIDAVSAEVAIDPRRVSIWGASMGGAGATTIAFHHPDRFAYVASYFGDSKYDMTTYVKNVLGGDAGAHAVNALDVVENARWLPVFLVHGEADKTSPIRQSEMLYDAMKKEGFDVTFERVAGMGHQGALVARYLARVVDAAATAARPLHPARVSFRSVRPGDVEAYGVRLTRARDGDAFVDVAAKDDGSVVVTSADNVAAIAFARGALGVARGAPVHLPPAADALRIRWSP